MSRAPVTVQIATVCAAKGWKDYQLADHLGVERTALPRWKSGRGARGGKQDELYALYLDALATLNEGDPIGRIERMRQEMRDAIGLMSAETIEAMHFQICKAGAADAYAKFVSVKPALQIDGGDDEGGAGEGVSITDSPRPAAPKRTNGILSTPDRPRQSVTKSVARDSD